MCSAHAGWLKAKVNEWSGHAHSLIFLTDEEFHLPSIFIIDTQQCNLLDQIQLESINE